MPRDLTMPINDSKLVRKHCYINGEWVGADNGETMPVTNKATGELLGVVPKMGAAETRRAIEGANLALPAWRAKTAKERAVILRRWYELMLKHQKDLATIMTAEQGKPMAESMGEVLYAASFIEWFAEEGKRLYGDTIPTFAPDKRVLVVKEPIGVVAAITPWNFPAAMITRKSGPALAAGCTMVLKPSELAPLSSMILAEIIDEAKFPAGVFNLINGDGATTGDALTSHPDVNMISFTGSTRAGALISQNAAKDFKRISLELGGKGANIIFKDADPEAVERGANRCFRNSGQSCNAPTRMLVEKSMYNEAVERVKKFANELKVDDPTKEGDHIGPVISETQFNKIQTLIQKGINEGAKLVAGGPGKPDGLDKGYFVKPTAFADVNNQMEIARTEIFGPVLSIIPFETEEEAIKIANDTPYGLTNYIQTQDHQKANRVARKLRSGMVDVNGAGIAVDAPFGGYKHSGIGREAGAQGIEEFLEIKTVGGWNN